MPTIEANGITIYYEEFGEGPPLLFFNGSFSTLATSRPLVQVFGSRLHTVAHDQRGLGKTSIPTGPYTMAEYAADGLAVHARGPEGGHAVPQVQALQQQRHLVHREAPQGDRVNA